MTMAKIFKCTPREKILDDSIPGSCIDWQKLLNASGIFNISSDILILLIPLKGIWSLQIERKRKIGIYLIFTFGTVYVLLLLPSLKSFLINWT